MKLISTEMISIVPRRGKFRGQKIHPTTNRNEHDKAEDSRQNEAIQTIQMETIKKKKNFLKPWIIMTIMLFVFFILSGIAIGIFFIVQSTHKTNLNTEPLLRWNSTGITIAGIAGSSGRNASQFKQPFDIVVKSMTTLYVADFGNNRIQKWIIGDRVGQTVAGHANGSRGNNTADLYGPSSIIVDDDDNIYIADQYNHRIQFYANGVSYGSTFAGTGSAGSADNQLSNPYGLSRDPTTHMIYIADYSNHRIMSYRIGATVGQMVAGKNISGNNSGFLYFAVRVHFESSTHSLYINNLGQHNIIRWILGADAGTLVAGSIQGLSGNSSRQLSSPMALTLDPMGNVYVADTINHRIQFFAVDQTNGITIAGVTGVTGSNPSLLSHPYSVKLDDHLNLYVADTGNYRVQKYQRY